MTNTSRYGEILPKWKLRTKMPSSPSDLSLKELTPKKCTFGPSCPAVFQQKSDNHYIIIGKICDPNTLNLTSRVGVGEMVVKISNQLLEGAVRASLAQRILTHAVAAMLGASSAFLFLRTSLSFFK